jgi:hypothetical protein
MGHRLLLVPGLALHIFRAKSRIETTGETPRKPPGEGRRAMAYLKRALSAENNRPLFCDLPRL